MWFNRNQWFFGDEWAFFAHRMTGWGGRVLFAPHNEHWSTAPILVYRALYAVAGLRTYVPYVVVLVVLHLATAHLLWRVMNRVGVAPLVATALAAVFAVLGSGGENLLWAFQIGFVGSVALGLVHLLLADHPGPFGRRDRLAWAVAVAGLAFSGISVTMTATSGLVVLLRRGLRDAVATVAPPAAVYVVWFAAVGHEGLGGGGGRLVELLDVPAYLWTGLSAALEDASGIPGAGAVLVVVVTGWLLRQRAVLGTPRALPTGMAAGSACLFVMLAAGRSGLGVEQATSSRYLYIAAALVLPTVGLMLSEATRHLAARQLAAVAVLVPVLVHNVAGLRELSHHEADREDAVRRRLWGALALVGQGDPELASTVPEPRFTPNASVDVLRRLDREGALPDDHPGEADVLAAAAQLQVALLDAPPAAAAVEPFPAVEAAVNDRGCLLVGPSGAMPVDVAFAGPDAVSLRTPTGGEVVVTVHSRSRPGVTGPPRTLSLRPGTTEWLWVTRVGTITLSVPSPAATEVCGVRPGAAGGVSS
ncbi:MAG: hypothetical protein ACLGIO_00400 [Acidimicrobiia bacterium]